MKRRLIPVFCLSLALVAFARSNEDLKGESTPAENNAPSLADEEAYRQMQLKQQFEEFKSQLIRLAQRLEQSVDAANRDKAKILRQAVDKANDLGTEIKFEKLINQLKLAGNNLTLDDLSSIMEKHEDLHADIRAILVILLSDDRGQLKKDIELWKLRIEALKRIIAQQDRISTQGYLGKIDSSRLTKDETTAAEATKKLLPQPSRDAGTGSTTTNGPRVLVKDMPGIKKIEQATEDQARAIKEYESNDREQGSRDVDVANHRLKDVLKQWEKILRQLREEEIERVLAALQAQCERMLALQLPVRDETASLKKSLDEHADRPSRADNHKALHLADQEREIVRLAELALQSVKEEGTAIALLEELTQVRDDARNVETRLRQADASDMTVVIEDDIISSLREMIDALKKARKMNGNPPPPDGESNPPKDPKLVDRLAELKMLRSMQIRVNARTKSYAREFGDEQVPDLETIADGPERARAERVQREFKDLAIRQQRIVEIAGHLSKTSN